LLLPCVTNTKAGCGVPSQAKSEEHENRKTRKHENGKNDKQVAGILVSSSYLEESLHETFRAFVLSGFRGIQIQAAMHADNPDRQSKNNHESTKAERRFSCSLFLARSTEGRGQWDSRLLLVLR
jgi:hypothetical protein